MNILGIQRNNLSRSLMVRSFAASLALALSACSSMPEAIQYENPQEISVQSVHQGSTDIAGQTVRWGGVITQVINNEQGTWVEVLALNLNANGKPDSNRLKNEGRFIAKVDQFLDPEVYQQGYSFTAVGTIEDKIDGKIGDFKYSYPTINAQGHYLWPKYSPRTQHYVMPGYWYYGFHSHWRFGYNYYGYGIRSRHGYNYPYYPFYGHMTRRITHVNTAPPRAVTRRNYQSNINIEQIFKSNTQRLTRASREAVALTQRAGPNANTIGRQRGNEATRGNEVTRSRTVSQTRRSSTRATSVSRSSRNTNQQKLRVPKKNK